MNPTLNKTKSEEDAFLKASLFKSEVQHYETCLLLNPDDLESLLQLGLVYAKAGDQITALDCFQRAMKLNAKNPALHNNMANAYRQLKQFDHAKNHYLRAIALDPNYALAHNNLAAILAMQNDYAGALQHYRDAVHAAPDFTQAHYNLGVLLLKNQQLEAAAIQFNNVLTLNPGNINALFYQGVLYLEKNQLLEAEQAFKAVLKASPEHVLALNNLGVTALKNDQGQLAVEYFTSVLTLDIEHEEARSNLAATFISHDRFENALTHYQILLEKTPPQPEYLYNAGVAYMALGHLREAKQHFERVLQLNPKHCASLNNLAALAIRRKDPGTAIPLLKQALLIDPKDTASQHMLNALEGTSINPVVSTEYAANLFNNYALHYDQHMQGQLAYQLPEHLRLTCLELRLNKVSRVLDLGCGTGLCGAILRPLTNELTGVDIAAKMIKQARNKGIYDHLFEAEITAFLNQNEDANQAHFDLIVCADTLPYFGELDSVFSAINQRLLPEGYFIFSTEISKTEPWHLQPSARFCHHINYLEQLSAEQSWTIRSLKPVTARLQDQQALPVYWVVIQKTKE